MERLSFYINKKIVYVNIERTTNKNMYLKVRGEDIVVTAPKRMSEKYIQAFVSEHIEKFVKYVEETKSAALYSIQESFVYLYGIKYDYKVLTGFKKSRLVIKDKSVYIEAKEGSDEEVEKIIKAYLKESLLKYITKVSPKFEKKLGVPQHAIRVTYKTRTWGTNMVQKRSISYSSRLAHYKYDVIDYVVVHELAHHIEPNHQANFWEIVKSVVPDYKSVQKVLRENKSLDEE